jgi:hypothetical protein
LDLGISELYVRDKDIGLLRGGVEEQEAVMNGSHTINICMDMTLGSSRLVFVKQSLQDSDVAYYFLAAPR